MAGLKDRPRVTYQRLNAEFPFLLSVDEGRVLAPMRLGDARGLRLDLEAAFDHHRAAQVCTDDEHQFVPAAAQPLLPDGVVAIECRHCPAHGAVDAGCFIPAPDGSSD